MSDHYWLKFRPFRQGYRAEGSYVEKYTGKKHLFFKTEEQALKVLKSLGVSQNTHEERSTQWAKGDRPGTGQEGG